MQIEEILTILPQRFPFVMIDRVLELEPSKKIVALKNVTGNEGYFAGHFPAKPIMPGVLMLEAAAQAAIVLFYASKPAIQGKKLEYYFGSVKVRFLSPVVPGDQLLITVEPVKMLSNAGIMKVKAQVAGRDILEGELSFAAKG